MPPAEADLGPAELEVLAALWNEGPAAVRQVLNALHRRGRTVAYTTVLTFLTRLEQKGFVESDRSQVAYIYRARVSRQNVLRPRLKELARTFYDGAAAPLVLQLMRDGSFSAAEIEELQKRIDQLDKRQQASGS